MTTDNPRDHLWDDPDDDYNAFYQFMVELSEKQLTSEQKSEAITKEFCRLCKENFPLAERLVNEGLIDVRSIN